MGSMIDQCIGNATGNPRPLGVIPTQLPLPGVSTLRARLLDLISVPDANGNTTTMYDLLVSQTKDHLNIFFSLLYKIQNLWPHDEMRYRHSPRSFPGPNHGTI